MTGSAECSRCGEGFDEHVEVYRSPFDDPNSVTSVVLCDPDAAETKKRNDKLRDRLRAMTSGLNTIFGVYGGRREKRA